MKIKMVVESAKGRFHMLLTEEPQVQSFLVKALTTYQDYAGCKRTLVINEFHPNGHEMPEAFLALAVCKNAAGNFVPLTMAENDEGLFNAFAPDGTAYPISVEYFVHLAGYAAFPDKHIPNRIAGMIIDYLECLIAMDNDDRLARIESAGKMDTSRTPTRIDRIAQKDALELQFRSNREFISMISIHPT